MISVNGHEIKPTIFPDGTSQVWKLDLDMFRDDMLLVTWKFENESELFHLAQLKTLMNEYKNRRTRIHLSMPYLPYARQDKEISNESTFAFFTFASMINNMDFDSVVCMDAHSDKAYAIKNLTVTYPTNVVKNVFNSCSSNVVVYPDQGACKKYITEYCDLPYMYGEKIRNQITGNITNYVLKEKLWYKPLSIDNVLIVDDICDGGATFIILAKKLYEQGAKNVNLFVSHGIFSKGTQVLRDTGIKRIFTKDGEVL